MNVGYACQDIATQIYGGRCSGKSNTYLRLWLKMFGDRKLELQTLARLMGSTVIQVKV